MINIDFFLLCMHNKHAFIQRAGENRRELIFLQFKIALSSIEITGKPAREIVSQL